MVFHPGDCFCRLVSRRSKSLALHAARSRSINSDTGEDSEGSEPSPDNTFSNTLVISQNQEATPPVERKPKGDASMAVPAALDRAAKEAEGGESRGEEEREDADRLFVHFRDNIEAIKEFCRDTVQQIPIPEQCAIEGNVDMTDVMLPFLRAEDNVMTVISVYLGGGGRKNPVKRETEGGFV